MSDQICEVTIQGTNRDFIGKPKSSPTIALLLSAFFSPAMADVSEVCREAFVEAGGVPFTESCVVDSMGFQGDFGKL